MQLPHPTHLKYTNLLSEIEKGEIKIPQFQRDFVWSVQRSAALIDSVIKGYPIGTFIHWITKERLRTVRDIGGIKLPPPRDGESVAYVLDGQQRLTSLFAALKGLTVKRSSGAEENFSAIYVNLEAGESDPIIRTDLTGIDANTCIRLSDLLAGSLAKLAAYPERFHSRIDDLRRRITSYDFPIVEVREAAIDQATEIFARINVGGQELSLFEIMVAKTYDEERDFDLKARFDHFIEARLQPIGYDTVSNMIMLQLVAILLGQDCKRQTILGLGRGKFIDTWPMAEDAIERAIDYLRDTYRIPVSRLLPYNTLLVPFAYFFHNHKAKPQGDQKALLEDFFWRCALGARYSSAVESKLTQDIQRIDGILAGKAPAYDWPVDISSDFIRDNGWFSTNRSFVKALLCLYAYHEPKSFPDDATVRISNDWLKQANSRNYHHFFPRSYLAKRGMDDAQANNILNITIVDDHLNKGRIGARAPSTYMKEFRSENRSIAATMRTHLIDDLDAFGVWSDDYEAFIRNRAELVSKELRKRVILRDDDRTIQQVRTDDAEEDPSTYE